MDSSLPDVRPLDPLHAVEHLLPAPRLPGVPHVLRHFRPQGEPPDHRLEPADFLLLVVESRLLLERFPELFHAVGGVVPLVPGNPPVFDFEDAIDDPVEEVPVVGDEEHGFFVRPEKPFQPLQPLEVEVIPRFVEKQDVRLLQQDSRQGDGVLLTAAERIQRPLPHRSHLQSLEKGVDLVLETVAAKLLQPGRDAAVLRQQGFFFVGRCGFQALFQGFQLPRYPRDFGKGFERLLVHRSPLVVPRLLRQVPDTASPGSGDHSG